MFDRIWKDQIVQPKGKLGIWKPKEELKPREEEDDDKCWPKLKKALELLDDNLNLFQNIKGSKWKRIPENIACEIIESFGSQYNDGWAIGHGMVGSMMRAQKKEGVKYIWSIEYYLDDFFQIEIRVEHENYHLIKYHVESDWESEEYNQQLLNVITKFLAIMGHKPYYTELQSWMRDR